MTSRRRWLIVAVCVVLLSLTPYAVSRVPAGHSSVSATTLLARIVASAGVPYTGYAESIGRISLPDVPRFTALVGLLGGRTDLRVWWRTVTDWRVDAVSLTGETDVHQDSTGIWTWDYEGNRATRVGFTRAPDVRLPRADDLLPASLGRRLLVQATSAEVTRLPDARIAGHDAAGLRLRPTEPESTIGRVDVWALPSSGLPVKVAVYGRSGGAALSTTMLDLSTSAPSASDTAFTAPGGARVDITDVTDIVSALNRFVQAQPPQQLAGLDRTSESGAEFGSVGVYGRGVTAMIAIPLLPRQFVQSIDAELAGIADTSSGGADVTAFGPVEMRLTAPASDGTRWLLLGTVTAATLRRAETQLAKIQAFIK